MLVKEDISQHGILFLCIINIESSMHTNIMNRDMFVAVHPIKYVTNHLHVIELVNFNIPSF